MTAYYNENDKHAAAWLRELIKRNLIAPGVVDERSIVDVQPEDLDGFTQCHFFAGIGGWSYALRLAGWPDDRPVWTGSCPCQPFSTAGQRKGTADERHLWPEMYRLVRKCRPAICFGEQVEAAVRLGWVDGVRTDLEAENYAFGFHVLGAHSIGQKKHPLIVQSQEWAYEMADSLDRVGRSDEAEQFRDFADYLDEVIVGPPHIRQRIVWVADATRGQREQRLRPQRNKFQRPTNHDRAGWLSNTNNPNAYQWSSGREQSLCKQDDGDRRMANLQSERIAGTTGTSDGTSGIDATERGQQNGQPIEPITDGAACRMGNATIIGRDTRRPESGRSKCVAETGWTRWMDESIQPRLEGHAGDGDNGNEPGRITTDQARPIATAGRDCWSDFNIVPCGDGKSRRIEPGIAPLAHGLPARVVRLRGYGNAIVPQVAAEFIGAWLECEAEMIGGAA